MKRMIIFLFVLFFVAEFSYSQYDGNFRLGLKAAPSLGWIKPKSDTILANGTHVGFSFGLISEFVLAENYSFATGFDVAAIGGKAKYQSYKDISYDDYKLKYLEIPLTLKMKTNQISYTSIYGQIGLGVGFNLNSRSAQKITDLANVEISNKSNLDVKKEINFIRASLIIGGGAEIAILGNTAILVGVTYNNGFLNMFSSNNANDKNAANNYVALNIGILF
jgi:hypothetical protein